MRAKEVIEIYSKRAKGYNKSSEEDKYAGNNVMIPLGLKLINKNCFSVLDLGCGTGLSSKKLFNYGAEITGIDVSSEMIKIAKKYPYKKIIKQDLEKIWKVKKKFDLILAIGVTEFIEDIPKLFDQVLNHLNEDGIFLVTFPSKMRSNSKYNIKSYLKKEVENKISALDFRILRYKRFQGYFKYINGKREIINYLGYVLKNKN